MSEFTRNEGELRVLLLAPTNKDAALTQATLRRVGIETVACADLAHVCRELSGGAGAVLLPEDALGIEQADILTAWVARQPAWSDLPILILARSGADSPTVARAMAQLGNVTVLELPIRVAALVSAVRTALASRRRQYQIRENLAELKKAEETQILLAAIVANSDDAIISKTLEGIIQTWNAGAERLFGYTSDEAVGKPITLLIPPERHHEERSILARLRQGERVAHYETVRVAKDGRRMDISLTVSPVRDSAGNIIGASKVARDITDRKRAEEALRAADRRKDEFLATLAHELRNPLAPIRNSLHILRLASGADPTAERVGTMMERQINHLVRLVDDLLEVSRITRGVIELRKEPVELASILRAAVDASRPLLDAAGHQLAISIPPDSITVDGDSVRLTQIFTNLLNNAAKYTSDNGQIWLAVRPGANEVAVSVRDNGAGIPGELLGRVFDMFMQVDRLSDRGQGGLGIGLTLVKSLVELHGGRVAAKSGGRGRGSEFIVHLPLVKGVVPIVPELASQPDAALSPRRVLVVDDNQDAAESLGMLLRLMGAEAHVVYRGDDALRALATFRPAVVLMDIGMPHMDGYEVARQIRQQPEFHDVTLIALSGWGQEKDKRRSELAGFNHHLVKPADVNALETLLLSLESR